MRVWVLLLSIVVFTSCKKELEKPKNFIEKDKMTAVLYDLALLGGIENIGAFYADSTASIFSAKAVLKKHQLDSLTFAENNRYYIELGNETYFQMQEEIKKRLEVKKAELSKLEKEKQEKAKKIEEDNKASQVKIKATVDMIRSKISDTSKQE